jgi:sugar O-acyltransferase (sialic acid O-acetyltransferase NeuD family)
MQVLILGAGGHGRVVAEAARTIGLETIGFLDDSPALVGTLVMGIKVLGDTDLLKPGALIGDGVLLGVGRNAVRLDLRQRMQALGLALPSVVHPRAWVSPSASLGPATVIMANAAVQTGCRLGAAVIVNTNASVDHDGMLADGVHVSPGAHLAGNVTVGEGTHIGIGATVIEGITIGRGCLIAAGAVVVRDVRDGQRVAGVPARAMKPAEQE